jgi:hypothetical protein
LVYRETSHRATRADQPDGKPPQHEAVFDKSPHEGTHRFEIVPALQLERTVATNMDLFSGQWAKVSDSNKILAHKRTAKGVLAFIIVSTTAKC